MESAQRELATAIEAGDAKAQVEANKRIATLAFDNAKLEQAKENKEDVKLSDGGKLPTQHHRLYLNNLRILKRKHGLQKTNGSVKTER